MNSTWRPTADIETLKIRAQLLADIRHYFASEKVYEVDVPTLARFTVTDPNIESIQATCNGQPAYLQTSPEYYMKRLLAAGSGDIYYLGKAFRDDEFGSKHNPEFTMLEWYRTGYDDKQLIDDALSLLSFLLPKAILEKNQIKKISYRELFEKQFYLNPHNVELNTIKAIAKQHCNVEFDSDDIDVWLNLLFTHVIEPAMQGWFVVYDFPESQGALAKKMVNAEGDKIAKRFEIYFNGLELANGYWELTNAVEQHQRFQNDIEQRKNIGARVIEHDESLLMAMKHGMPECAGVALGVDRLLMIKCGFNDIKSATAFSF